MWTHLHPALGRASTDIDAQEQLACRLGGLELPAFHAAASPVDPEPWLRQPFRVQSTDPHTTLTSLQLQRSDAAYDVTLNEPDNALSFAIGTHGWTVSTPVESSGKVIPVAASGGWSAQGALQLEVIFLETPHRMDVVCSLDDRCARASWRLPPLGSPQLQDMRSPT
jgi:hypothetical protein